MTSAAGRPLVETVGEHLGRATSLLEAADVPEPRSNAERMLASLLRTDRGGLLARRRDPLPEEAARRYAGWLERRVRREPLQHILGTQEFYGLEFEVDGSVLIPRQETELLVDRVLELCRSGAARVVDLGTGSGCIPIALAGETSGEPELFAVERSVDALATARRNARRHGLEHRVQWFEGDFARLPAQWSGTFDVVVSNPPYVRQADWAQLEPEVRDHDPRDALVAGEDGLDAYRVLMPVAAGLLREGGTLALELGHGQADDVTQLAEAAGFSRIEILPDLAGIPRIFSARSETTR